MTLGVFVALDIGLNVLVIEVDDVDEIENEIFADRDDTGVSVATAGEPDALPDTEGDEDCEVVTETVGDTDGLCVLTVDEEIVADIDGEPDSDEDENCVGDTDGDDDGVVDTCGEGDEDIVTRGDGEAEAEREASATDAVA